MFFQFCPVMLLPYFFKRCPPLGGSFWALRYAIICRYSKLYLAALIVAGIALPCPDLCRIGSSSSGSVSDRLPVCLLVRVYYTLQGVPPWKWVPHRFPLIGSACLSPGSACRVALPLLHWCNSCRYSKLYFAAFLISARNMHNGRGKSTRPRV